MELTRIRIVANNIGTEQNEKVYNLNVSHLNTREGFSFLKSWIHDIVKAADYNAWSEFVITDMERNKVKQYNLFNYFEELQECDIQGENTLYKKRELISFTKLALEMTTRIKKEFC